MKQFISLPHMDVGLTRSARATTAQQMDIFDPDQSAPPLPPPPQICAARQILEKSHAPDLPIHTRIYSVLFFKGCYSVHVALTTVWEETVTHEALARLRGFFNNHHSKLFFKSVTWLRHSLFEHQRASCICCIFSVCDNAFTLCDLAAHGLPIVTIKCFLDIFRV